MAIGVSDVDLVVVHGEWRASERQEGERPCDSRRDAPTSYECGSVESHETRQSRPDRWRQRVVPERNHAPPLSDSCGGASVEQGDLERFGRREYSDEGGRQRVPSHIRETCSERACPTGAADHDTGRVTIKHQAKRGIVCLSIRESINRREAGMLVNELVE